MDNEFRPEPTQILQREGEPEPEPVGARLVVISGADAGRLVLLSDGVTTIGRTKDRDLFLQAGSVSKRHAKVTGREDRFFISDLASTNGTRLNGRSLDTTEVELASGDALMFGDVSVLFLGAMLAKSHGEGPTIAINFDAAAEEAAEAIAECGEAVAVSRSRRSED